jgi:sigma-B regulation protein RsbU (phosphoserine phosphatase)
MYLAGRELKHEIDLARSVQRDLLPASKCEFEGFDVAADFTPFARVSGDFYDVFGIGRDGVAFVLGDVSGNGISAALLTGVLYGAVRSSGWTESRFDHQEATRQLNHLLCERAATSRFATMFWSYFDRWTQHLKYINAGHCPPLLVKADGRNTILHLTSGGPVLGLLNQAEFQQGSVRLDPGDVLLLYSDGFAEATNATDEEFGAKRMAAAVVAHPRATAAEIRDRIVADVNRFTGIRKPQDDRTLVVIVYTSENDTALDEVEAFGVCDGLRNRIAA